MSKQNVVTAEEHLAARCETDALLESARDAAGVFPPLYAAAIELVNRPFLYMTQKKMATEKECEAWALETGTALGEALREGEAQLVRYAAVCKADRRVAWCANVLRSPSYDEAYEVFEQRNAKWDPARRECGIPVDPALYAAWATASGTSQDLVALWKLVVAVHEKLERQGLELHCF